MVPDFSPAPVTRSNAAADQRRRILRAIGELVAARGYADITVELIVKRARVSYKTFYKHFSGKEDCFLSLLEKVTASTEKTIRERLASEPREWPEQVTLALRTLVECILADPMIARAVSVESPIVSSAAAERYREATNGLAALFHAGRELTPRGADLPASVEDSLVGSVFWSIYQHLLVGEVDELAGQLPAMTELVLGTYLGQDEGRYAAAEGRTPALA